MRPLGMLLVALRRLRMLIPLLLQGLNDNNDSKSNNM